MQKDSLKVLVTESLSQFMTFSFMCTSKQLLTKPNISNFNDAISNVLFQTNLHL